ncbi:MAG: response regulator [Myxococcota bacterium]|nr:response regulator [Myxococcota bacterium]
METKLVLVVDDEVDLAQVVADALADEGYAVAIAHDGRIGLLRLAEHKTDLVLLDIMMPSPDGPEMLAKMRATPAFADIPVVVMTTAEYDGIAASLPPHQGVLSKPFTHRELLDTVARLVGAHPNA